MNDNRLPADTVIVKKAFQHFFRIINVPAVKNGFAFHQLFDHLKLGVLNSGHSVTMTRASASMLGVVGVTGVADAITQDFAGLLYGHRVVGRHRSPGFQRIMDDGQRGCLPHVVGFRLGMTATGQNDAPSAAPVDAIFAGRTYFSPVVDLFYGLQGFPGDTLFVSRTDRKPAHPWEGLEPP